MSSQYQAVNAMANAICGMKPVYGGTGMFTDNPVADAAEHFDRLADTFNAKVNYLGLSLSVEVDRGGHMVDVVKEEDGESLHEEFSERALRKILALACEGETA